MASRDLRLVLVGAGALGSAVAACLSRTSSLPLERVSVIDPDRLEPHNVALSRAYGKVVEERGAAAFSSNKADLLADFLNTQGIDTWKSLPVEIADVGWALLKKCDLILNCTDSALSRVETAWAARSLHKPMLDGALRAQDQGRVAWFAPSSEAACYLCSIGEVRRAELLAFAMSENLGCRPPAENGSMRAQEIDISLIESTAEVLVQAVCRWNTRRTARNDRAWLPEWETSWAAKIDGPAPDAVRETLRLVRSATCPWHENERPVWVPVEQDRSFHQLLLRLGSSSAGSQFQLPWPISLQAQCRQCGLRQNAPQRATLLRRRGRCSGCGSVGRMESLQTLSSLGVADPHIHRTPRELGLPVGHLLELRRTPTWAPSTGDMP